MSDETNKLLSPEEMKLYSVGGTNSSGSDGLSNIFLILVTNLVKKGGSAMIHLLGRFFGVSVDNVDPDQIIDEFSAKLKDPDTQARFLEMIRQLMVVVSPALKEAIQQSVEIFQDALEKFFKSGILAAESAFGSLPVIGEMEEVVLTMLNTGRAIMAGINAVTNTATVGFNTVQNIKQGLSEPIPIPTQVGGKKIQGLKKLQTNSLKRISNAVREFQRTRRKNKRISKMRIPKLNTTRSRKRAKTNF